jgi:hypothetical protein
MEFLWHRRKVALLNEVESKWEFNGAALTHRTNAISIDTCHFLTVTFRFS